MDKEQLVRFFLKINSIDPTVPARTFEDLYKDTIDEILTEINRVPDQLTEATSSILGAYKSERTYEWYYITLNFFLLEELNGKLLTNELLSVKETSDLIKALGTLSIIGIQKNLQRNLAGYIKVPYFNAENITYNYEILKCTVRGFASCIKRRNLRMLFIPNHLQGVLIGALQLGFAPLKKPSLRDKKSTISEASSGSSSNYFEVSEAMYQQFKIDQNEFKSLLNDLHHNIYPRIFIVEIMKMFRGYPPPWLKKTIANFLTTILKSKNGLEMIILAVVDGNNDTAANWRIVEVLRKLILSCKDFPDFETNICSQLLNTVDKSVAEDKMTIFEQIFSNCTKSFYREDEAVYKRIFLERILRCPKRFIEKEYKFNASEDVTGDLKQSIRLIHDCFISNSSCLPLSELECVITAIFYFYFITENKSSFKITNTELRDIFFKYLECNETKIDLIFDTVLFNISEHLPEFRNDIEISINNKVKVSQVSHRVLIDLTLVINNFYKLLTFHQKTLLFGYLLKCISNKSKYFATETCMELLSVEEETITTTVNKLLQIHNLLAQLSEDKEVQKLLRNQPDDIINYINIALAENLSNPDASPTVFILIMILENLVMNSLPSTVKKYEVLCSALLTIASNTSSDEMKINCERIHSCIINKNNATSQNNIEKESEFQQALKEITSPLLPEQGHGYMTLAKLIEQKNNEAIQKKQYLLNLFQMALKNEDSYIYLNAIRGLAALGDLFTDTVLEVLCEEYSQFDMKGENRLEVRMKLGEVLVKIIRSLGDTAPHYKALLLNTFLSGTKDDDHLMRASSLSNLSEVCRILGYKIGTILTEVLVCVHSIITTDKAIEPRRAAVMVIRQLFNGLEQELISFLKDDILPIYRTLKNIYNNDPDDVMRLQAQLALEELNQNMKEFVLPKIEILHPEKKIITLD